MPLTRLAVGTRFALGLLRVTPAIARALAGRRRALPTPLLLLVGAVAALLGFASVLGLFGVYVGAAVSVLAGLVVVAVVFLVVEAIATDLRDGGRRREPWA